MAWAAVRDWLEVKVWTEGNEEAAPEGVRPFSRWHTLPDHGSLALAELAATGVPRNYAVVHAASERYLQESYQQAHNQIRSSSLGLSEAAAEGPALHNSDEEAEELLQSLMSKKSRKSLESAKSLAGAATVAAAATDAARSLAGIVIEQPIVRTPPPMVHSPLAAGGSGMAQSPVASPAVGLSQ